MSGGLALDGGWMEEEGGIKTVTFEGSCGEAFIGAHREDTYLHAVLFISNTVEFRLVLYLKVPRFFTSFVTYFVP